MRLAFCFCLLSLGCFGGSQNPSYFPYYLPTGDIIRTHAKPPGHGYFSNFDPKACKIEVTPAAVANPVRTQVVLLATVVDKDGDARRKRRVEWQLEGPGSIVEVDESGFLAGRGYQVTDKYAVSYTDMLTHTVSRGGDETRRDFTVCAGQSWCVVSSPVPGETIVTAYAPEVHDWEKRRAFAKLAWNGDGFAPVPVRSGRETDSSLLERAKAEGPALPSLVLDAQLAKTVAVNREVTATVSLANKGRAASPSASVRVVLPEGIDLLRSEPAASRRSGKDLFWNIDGLDGGAAKEIALVLRPTRAGPFAITAAADTADGLTASTRADSVADTAAMKVSVEAPKFAAAGERADVTVVVTNSGQVPIENAVAWVTPGTGLSAGATSPLEVKVGSVPAGQRRSATATLLAEQAGKATVRVDVTADGGLSARGEGTLAVGRAELTIRIVGPETVPVGDTATYEVQVANGSDLAAKDIAVQASFPRGLSVANAGEGSISSDGASWKLATLAPGEKRVLRLTAAGARLSEMGSITASASGSLANGGRLPEAKTSAPASVRGQPVLVLEVQTAAGPVSAGGRVTYRITVRNKGTGPARDVAVIAELSNELRAVKASPDGTANDRRASFDRLGDLAAGAVLSLTVDAEARGAGDARVNVTVTSKDLPSPLKDEQAARISSR